MKFSSIFGKKGFGKGSFGGKDSSGQSIKCIGGAHSRALSPRRWGKQKGRLEQSNCIGYSPFSPAAPKCFGRAARRVPSPSGRSMIEMLAVLAIVGVLSITALVGFTYAMNKHRANETIYDVMLRGTNVPMVDENYASKPSGHEFRFPDLPAGTYYPMATKKDAGSSYYVEATGVTYRVCEMILKMNPTDIDQIVVNNSVYTGDSDICGNTDGLAMKFCFGSDGTICDGTGHGGSSGGSGSGSSGGSSGGSGSGSGSGTDPVDPCEGIVCQYDGMCIDGVCRCVDGYSGDYCEIEPGLCQGIVCDGCRQCDPMDGLCKDSDALCGDEELCTRGVCEEETNALRVCKTSDELMAKLERCQNWCATHTQCNITVGCRIEASVTPNGQCGGPLNTHRCGVLYDNGSNGWNYYSAEYIYVCT